MKISKKLANFVALAYLQVLCYVLYGLLKTWQEEHYDNVKHLFKTSSMTRHEDLPDRKHAPAAGELKANFDNALSKAFTGIKEDEAINFFETHLFTLMAQMFYKWPITFQCHGP